MTKAVLFDLDGTLIDSAPDLTAAIDTVLLKAGYPAAGDAKVRAWVGNGAPMLVLRAIANAKGLAEHEVSAAEAETMLQQFKAVYRTNCCDQSRLYAGVLSTLAQLAQQSYPMAIVTNKPVEFAQQIVQHYGLADFCPVLFGGDSVTAKKPAADMLYAAAAALAVPITQCTMVGDSKADIAAAAAAGIPCLAVSYGYHRGDDLRALGAHHVVDDFSALLSLL